MAFAIVKKVIKTNVLLQKKYASWKSFWEIKKLKYFPTYCQCENCINEALIGGYVYLIEDPSQEFIIPLCKKCYEISCEVEIKVDSDYFVSVK